jgi:hypothetical protein
MRVVAGREVVGAVGQLAHDLVDGEVRRVDLDREANTACSAWSSSDAGVASGPQVIRGPARARQIATPPCWRAPGLRHARPGRRVPGRPRRPRHVDVARPASAAGTRDRRPRPEGRGGAQAAAIASAGGCGAVAGRRWGAGDRVVLHSSTAACAAPGRSRIARAAFSRYTEAPEPEDRLDAAATVAVNGPENAPFDWHAIDWRAAEENVRRLRQRGRGP